MIDSHCHLNDEAFKDDVEEVIARAHASHVTHILVLGWDIESSKEAIALAERHEGVYAAVGVHPQNQGPIPFSALEEIRELSRHEKVIAIGEIGLDFHWEKDPEVHERQKEWFIKQIELANELSLPVSIHARDATQATHDILKDHPVKEGAVLHCYSGSPEMMREFSKLGLYFGFDGPVTFKNSAKTKECAAICPLDKMLTETDSPYLSPSPFRGKRNEPMRIKEILEELAFIKGLGLTELDRQIETNFKTLFKL